MLLREAGIDFEACVSGVDETIEAAWLRLDGPLSSGERIAVELASRKARAVAASHPADRVLGADTVVMTEDGAPLGAPRDREDARRMIGLLNGRCHRVHTGLVLIAGGEERRRVETAIVRFRDLTPDEIEAYVETGEGDDKAGAYGYQGIGRRLVAAVEGDPETVIGLPVRVVREMLEATRARPRPRTSAALAALVAALCLLFLSSDRLLAVEWIEYRYVAPTVGRPFALPHDEGAVLTGGDTTIGAKAHDRRLEILAVDTAPRRLLFRRPDVGFLEYIVEPTIESPDAPFPLPPPVVIGPAPSAERPVSSPSPPPPIVVPPPPTVLVTPPVSGGVPVSRGVPPRFEPVVSSPAVPVAAPASPPAVLPTARPISPPTTGPIVVERSAPLGRDRAPDTMLDRFGVTKPGEVAHFTLAQELLDRGLHGDAIAQFIEFVSRYPKSSMREAAMTRVGQGYYLRGVENERESARQRDLRRSGAANEAVDAAIRDFEAATEAYRVVQATFPNSFEAGKIQLGVAASLHGRIRARFLRGGVPEDEPAVVVEYLRVTAGHDDTRPLAAARLGIARYYRDLGDARMAARLDRVMMVEPYNRAVKEYLEIIDAFPMSEATEEALIDLARLFDRNLEMRRFDEAVRLYDLLVSRFPTSRYAEEARLRSRWLKENYL